MNKPLTFRKLIRANLSRVKRWHTTKKVASRKVVMEIADTIIYGVLLAARVDEDLEAAIRTAFNRKSIEYGFPERL